MFKVNPLTRLSAHFILADFLGNHSVYSKGLRNVFAMNTLREFRLNNARTLCALGLEPILDRFGPISISYGFISDELSQQIVKYQDPKKRSHHRWDLGAACDFIAHDWVEGGYLTEYHVNDAPFVSTSPIALAHEIDQMGIPYSRMITYSESPYICLALTFAEVDIGEPRKAFYENRYMGTPKVKPDYRSYATPAARQKAYKSLLADGLPVDWIGAGYPTHHGGGFEQYQHRRVSRYTMVSDWLLDLKSISNGDRNIPDLGNEDIQDAFAAAGMAYDRILHVTGAKRMSIVAGFVSHNNPNFDPEKDWRSGWVYFSLVPPEGSLDHDIWGAIQDDFDPRYSRVAVYDEQIHIEIEVEYVLSETAWED